jgi:hypothetical protein
MTESRITNEDAEGDYLVVLIAFKNRVASFSVKSLDDAQYEAGRLAKGRQAQGKPTHRAYARQIESRKVIKRQRYFTFGQEIELNVAT